MMQELDTGICAPESVETLLLQQKQLVSGKRPAQMFPVGTEELSLPQGFNRHVNFRGVFHYNPNKTSVCEIDLLGLTGSENKILNLGPYNKHDLVKRVMCGDKVTCIAEYTKDGIEIRTAAATEGTLKDLYNFFEKTKEQDTLIKIGVLPSRVTDRK